MEIIRDHTARARERLAVLLNLLHHSHHHPPPLPPARLIIRPRPWTLHSAPYSRICQS